MEKIFVNTPGSRSEILVGEHWESVKEMLPERGVVIITDDNVRNVYMETSFLMFLFSQLFRERRAKNLK